MTLPTNIDVSYPDRSAGDAVHQQHHDSVHAFYNKFDHSAAAAAGNTWVWDATAGVYKPGSGASPTDGLVEWKAGEWLLVPPPQNANFTFADGDTRLHPLVTRGATADRIGCEVVAAGTVGSVVRLVIYEDANGDGIPDTLVLDAGTVSGETTGVKLITISQVLPTISWVAAINQGGATTRASLVYTTHPLHQRRQSDANPVFNRGNTAPSVSGLTGAAPATITPTLAGGAAVNPPLVTLRKA